MADPCQYFNTFHSVKNIKINKTEEYNVNT